MALSNTGNSYISVETSTPYMVIVRKELRPTFRFILDKFKEKNGQFPIVGRLIIERRKVELSTNIMVKKTEWDLINGQLKNKLKNHEAHKKLIKMESEILQIIEHREAKGLPITSKIIKKIYQI